MNSEGSPRLGTVAGILAGVAEDGCLNEETVCAIRALHVAAGVPEAALAFLDNANEWTPAEFTERLALAERPGPEGRDLNQDGARVTFLAAEWLFTLEPEQLLALFSRSAR